MTPYHPLTDTGTPPEDAAMIWPWPHNWASPVTRRPEWSTVVMTSATGAEQRQAIREYPREQVTYEHLLEGSDSAMAFALLREWKGRDWLVPDWTEATKTAAPAGAVLSLLRYSVPAGLALLGTEVVTLLDAEGTLEVAPSGSWPAGTTLVPLRPASLDADQTVSHVTGAVSRISPTFLFEDVRPLDETVLTRVAEPANVLVARSGVSVVEGRYGKGLVATAPDANAAVSRAGQMHVTGAHTLEFWAKVRRSDINGFHWLIHAVDTAPGSFTNPQVDFTAGWVWVSWAGQGGFAIPDDVWFHVAISREADLASRVFLNGMQVGATHTDPYGNRTFAAVTLFNGNVSGRSVFPGILDDVRMTHACRYTSNFTPSPCVIGEGDPYWSDVAFLVNGEVSRWGVDPSGAPTLDARAHMLPRAHNYASPGSTQVSRELDELDPGVGLRHTRPRHDISTSQWSYDALLESDRDILAFRALLQQHRGSAIGMYASPPGADLEVVEIVDGLVTVPGSQFWGSAPPAIDLLTPRGWECRKVASVSPAGVQLTNTGVQALPGEVVTARSVHRVRLLGDAVEIRYLTPGVAEVSLPVASTPDPFDSGGGGGGGGGGWAEVAVPSVTPPTPAGQVVLLIRGESAPLTDASPLNRTVSAGSNILFLYSPPLFGSETSMQCAVSASPFYVTAAASAPVIADGDFCAESFVYIRNYANDGIIHFNFGAILFSALGNGSDFAVLRIRVNNVTVSTVYGAAPRGQWLHIAWARKDGVISVYVSGVRVMQYAHVDAIDMTTALVGRGQGFPEGSPAYMKYARITVGDSVYSGTSFPPLTSGY